MNSPLPVVCALIEDGAGRVLLAQRPAHKHLGFKWEFPGGKVEAGEPPAAALARELREELGCEVTALAALPCSRHDYGSVTIEMIPFVCRLAPAIAGSVRPRTRRPRLGATRGVRSLGPRTS
jgi:8-oxo-dGTP diphosphatase